MKISHAGVTGPNNIEDKTYTIQIGWSPTTKLKPNIFMII